MRPSGTRLQMSARDMMPRLPEVKPVEISGARSSHVDELDPTFIFVDLQTDFAEVDRMIESVRKESKQAS